MKKEQTSKKTSLEHVAWILVIVGSLNWLLVGVFRFNLVEKLFHDGLLARLIYIMVGAAAIYLVMHARGMCLCGGKGCAVCRAMDKGQDKKEE